jgi:hypothetical protein
MPARSAAGRFVTTGVRVGAAYNGHGARDARESGKVLLGQPPFRPGGNKRRHDGTRYKRGVDLLRDRVARDALELVRANSSN